MTSPKAIGIDRISLTSLRLEARARGNLLGTATGFTIEHEGQPLLITNWHVVTGRHAETGGLLSKTAATPDELWMFCHAMEKFGLYREHRESLYEADGATPRWLEHPQGKAVDVVALPLRLPPSLRIYPLDLALAETDLEVKIAMPVSIVGYPKGLMTSGVLPIWKTGHLASEPELNYDGQPAILIDATTRSGMSGSPVVLRVYRQMKFEHSYLVVHDERTRFLGVYSGRIDDEIEIGRVWRPLVIQEILKAPRPGGTQEGGLR
jgi:hypothetical protein